MRILPVFLFTMTPLSYANLFMVVPSVRLEPTSHPV
jgi:hypothetical protein